MKLLAILLLAFLPMSPEWKTDMDKVDWQVGQEVIRRDGHPGTVVEIIQDNAFLTYPVKVYWHGEVDHMNKKYPRICAYSWKGYNYCSTRDSRDIVKYLPYHGPKYCKITVVLPEEKKTRPNLGKHGPALVIKKKQEPKFYHPWFPCKP